MCVDESRTVINQPILRSSRSNCCVSAADIVAFIGDLEFDQYIFLG
jgi:hypothetical protein